MNSRVRTAKEMHNLDDDDYLLPAEVASMFRVDPKTVTRWAKAGKVPHIRTLGGHTRFRYGTMKELLNGGKDPA